MPSLATRPGPRVEVRARVRALAMPALLLVITAGFYWKVTLTRQYTWLEAPECAARILPWLDFQAREVHAGRLPFWDPYLWGGQSLIGQVQPGTANPLNWALFALPLRDGHIRPLYLNWYWVLLHWLGALSLYALCRDLQAGRAASLLGAAGFGLGGFMGFALQPQALAAALWIPLSLLYFFRVLRAARPVASAALSGAAVGMACLSGDYEVPLFLALAMAALWAYLLATGWRSGRRWGCAAVFAAVALLVPAFQWVPAVEYGRHAVRWTGQEQPQRASDAAPYPVQDAFAQRARSVPGLIVPGWGGEANSFLGVVVVTFAAAGVALGWRRRETKLLAALALAATALSLGNDDVFSGMLYALVPFVGRARGPASCIAVAQAAICALAAFGLDGWPGLRGARAARWWLVGFGAAVMALYTALALARVECDQRPAVTALAALLLAAALYGWQRGTLGARGAAASALLLALLEAGTVSTFSIPEATRRDSIGHRMQDEADMAAWLRLQPGWFRVQADPRDVPYNFGDWFGIDQSNGSVPSLPEKMLRLARREDAARLFGVGYYLSRNAPHAGLVDVFESATGVKVFRDPKARPPLWTLHDAPAGGAAPPCAAEDDKVRLESRTASAVVVVAEMRCPGTVVLADAYAPGWLVWVDRRRGIIREVEGALRGVAVDAGAHRIEFRYRAVAYWGAGLSLLGILLTAVLARRGGGVH